MSGMCVCVRACESMCVCVSRRVHGGSGGRRARPHKHKQSLNVCVRLLIGRWFGLRRVSCVVGLHVSCCWFWKHIDYWGESDRMLTAPLGSHGAVSWGVSGAAMLAPGFVPSADRCSNEGVNVCCSCCAALHPNFDLRP